MDYVLVFVALVLLLFVVITAISHIWIRIPFVPTPKRVIKQVLNFAELKGDEVVVDLGAGDARFLTAAKKLMPNLKCSGYEIIPTIWLLGKIRIWFSRKKINWHCSDMMKADVSQTDCIFLYLIPEAMVRLREKFDKELRTGTKVISYGFMFRGLEPKKEIEVPWLFSKGKARLYVW